MKLTDGTDSPDFEDGILQPRLRILQKGFSVTEIRINWMLASS